MNYDVVIVGAGPTGLFLAIELAIAGVKPLVIERLTAPDVGIKAGAFGALAAEAMLRRGFEPGLNEAEAAMIAKFTPGVKADFASMMSAARGSPFKKLGGHFSGLFLIDQTVQRDPERRFRGVVQAELERLLAARAKELGIELRRGVELTSFAETEGGVDVETSAGKLTAQYLVGCDGGRSRVRKLSGIDFPGTDPTITGWQAMAELDAPEKVAHLRWARTPRGVVTYGPMAGRIFVLDFDGPPADRNAPVTREELEAALQRVSGTDVRVTGVTSLTRFTDNARQATTYQKGRVLLAGDAAHVHSPFGGQGINLGLVDAANLGWKLARTVRGIAAEGLLASYTSERHPVAARVLANTRAQVALMRPDVMTTALREIVGDLMAIEPANQYFGEMMSGTGVRYDLGDDHPLVGKLAKNYVLELPDREAHLYDLMHDGSAVVFGPSPDLEAAARGRARVVRTRTGPSMFVRPDGCIAWASHDGEEGADARLAPALDRWL